MKQNPKKEKVLLIDEVDVFFSKDFYGALYNPSVLLKDPKISDLLKYIWQERSTITYSKALNSPAFCACKEKFKNCEKLLFEVLKDIIGTVKSKIPKKL